MANRERMLSGHIGGEVPEEEKQETPQEQYEVRQEALRKSEDLETRLRREFTEKYGQEAPPGVNLSLRMVEGFRRTAEEAQDLRKVVKTGKGNVEALNVYAAKQEELQKYLSYGTSFEGAYREYLRSQRQFFKFSSGIQELSRLGGLMGESSFADLGATEKFDRKTVARVESVMQDADASQKPDLDQSLKALETIFPKGSKEYKAAEKEIKAKKEDGGLNTKKDIKKRIEKLAAETKELWEDPMVRYFWQKREIDNMLKDFSEGEDIIETQSVIKSLNKLHEWEGEHRRTTIGGVLVGPPGVGKTTLVRHYLEQKDRNYVYLDLSEEVTRYMLYGSKAIEFRSPTEYYQQLATDLGGLDEEGLKKFIEEHHEVVKNTFKVTKGESTAVLVGQVLEDLEKGKGQVHDKALVERLGQVKQQMLELTSTAFRRELSGQFGHLASRNGWRDGVIISALRRGDSIIFDEFNKNRNWSLIYSLMTAKPGENWYFADNDEQMKVPEDWRMYFTANIGAKHGVYPVPEAFASRATGKTLEVGYPPLSEEMKVALCALSNPEGDFLRSKDDLAKLFILVNEVFPKVRKFTEDKNNIIPISYRLLRDLGEKLVQYDDPKSGRPVYQPSRKSFDEALYEVMIGSYSLYEDEITPKEIANICTNVGLLLDDSVRERMEGWVGKDELAERKKTFEEHREDFKEIVKKVQGMTRDVSELPIPEKRQF